MHRCLVIDPEVVKYSSPMIETLVRQVMLLVVLRGQTWW